MCIIVSVFLSFFIIMEPVLFNSDNGNVYLYSEQNDSILLLHPFIKYLLNGNQITDTYYHSKYKYLKRFGFFDKKDDPDVDEVLNGYAVERGICQCSQVVFEVTDQCNLKCVYCSLGDLYSYKKREFKKLNLSNALVLLDYLFRVKPTRSSLSISFYGGEPLLNFNAIQTIVFYAKKKSNEKEILLSFNMTTNATLLDKYIEFLVENEIELLISLDGDEIEQSYRVYKDGDNSFKKVVYNIDIVQNNYPEYFANKVFFNSVLHNKNSVQGIYTFVWNRYKKIPVISPLNTEFVNVEKKEELKRLYHSKEESEMDFQKSGSFLVAQTHKESIIYQEVYRFMKYRSINRPYLDILSLLYDKIKMMPTGTCSPLRRRIFMNTNNQLLPCEKVCHKHALGSVDEQGVHIDVVKVAEKYNTYYRKVRSSCVQCYEARSCSTCLLSLERIDLSEMDNFICPFFMDSHAFVNKLRHIISFLEQNPTDIVKIVDDALSNNN